VVRKVGDAGRDRALKELAKASELPGGFARMSPGAKLSAILDLPEPAALVRRLRSDELYFLLNAIGLEDTHDLLAYASPEQRQAVVDLDAWSGWRFDAARFDRILELVRGVSYDLALDLLKGSDRETLALYVFSSCRVGLAGEESEDTGDDAFVTPDGVFVVSCDDPDRVPAVKRFLDLLYATDLELAHLVLHGGMRETTASLEDAAFRFRDARLQDLGFPAADERFAIYEPFDVAAVRARLAVGGSPPRGAPASPPLALALVRAEAPHLFWDALRGLDPAEGASVVHGILHLVNRVVAARTLDLHEEGAWDLAARHALSLVSIGLEDLAEGDREAAPVVLGRTWPVELYRAGLEAIRPAHLMAKRVVADVGGVAHLSLFAPDVAEALRAAMLFPPQLFEGLVRDGSATVREFRTLAEARRLGEACREARAVAAFANRVLGFGPGEGDAGAATFASVFATAWARTVLAGSPSPAPLDGRELRDLRAVAFKGARIRPALRRGAAALADRAPEADRARVAAFLDRAIDAVEDALGALDPASVPDVRFVGDALLVRP
jgi:hypothetical protein